MSEANDSGTVSEAPRRVVVEADGASRGNAGPAAYGAVLRDADTGEVIAEDGTAIGVATNNVAEYSGLVAGLRMAAELAPGAEVECRLDSKLVVEQMAGRWKIKHPDLRPLADEATRLAPSGTTYTWVPREQNVHADRLANEALDGKRDGVTVARGLDGLGPRRAEGDSLIEAIESPEERERPARGWAAPGGEPTTLVLVRHGVTPHTVEKRFSGGLDSANPGLSDEGRDQVRVTAEWLAPLASRVDAVIASPVRRTLESAEIVAAVLDKEVRLEPGFAEMEFGAWDGMTFLEVAEQRPDELDAWLGSLDVPAGEGSRSGSWRSGCSTGCSGCWTGTPGRPWSWSATSPRSRPWSHTRSTRRWGRCSGWSCPRRRCRSCRSSSAARTAPRSEPRCGCSTRCRRGTTRSPTTSAGDQYSATTTSSWVPFFVG